MSTRYRVRQKDHASPERINDQSDSVDSAIRILEKLEEFSKYNDSMFDFLLEIDKENLTSFIRSLNQILDPNRAIPFEYFKINRIRKAVYNLGHILESESGIASLEKIGFTFLEEKGRFFLLANHHTPIPEFLSPDQFFESVAHLFKALESYGQDDSYMWSFSDKFYYATVIKNGEIEIEFCSAPVRK